jgi:hypothetical protein
LPQIQFIVIRPFLGVIRPFLGVIRPFLGVIRPISGCVPFPHVFASETVPGAATATLGFLRLSSVAEK